MVKKMIAILAAMVILGGLAYYSGVLYSEKNMTEEQAHLKTPKAIFLEKQLSDLRAMEDREEELKQTREMAKQEASTQGEMVLAETEDYLYYLIEEFGYVNIYLADRETIYEYTNITMDMLPAALQSEISEGKGMTSERELYDFLENYSS